LLGYVSCTIGRLRVDGLTVRRSSSGRLSVSLPRRRGHPIVCPLVGEDTRSMETQILAALGLERCADHAHSRRAPRLGVKRLREGDGQGTSVEEEFTS